MVYMQALIKLWTLCVFNQPDSLKRSDAFAHYVQAVQLLLSKYEHDTCNTLSRLSSFCVIPCAIWEESSLMFLSFLFKGLNSLVMEKNGSLKNNHVCMK